MILNLNLNLNSHHRSNEPPNPDKARDYGDWPLREGSANAAFAFLSELAPFMPKREFYRSKVTKAAKAAAATALRAGLVVPWVVPAVIGFY